jgi:hypothetical protein
MGGGQEPKGQFNIRFVRKIGRLVIKVAIGSG